jgi:hypothetical protein
MENISMKELLENTTVIPRPVTPEELTPEELVAEHITEKLRKYPTWKLEAMLNDLGAFNSTYKNQDVTVYALFEHSPLTTKDTATLQQLADALEGLRGLGMALHHYLKSRTDHWIGE